MDRFPLPDVVYSYSDGYVAGRHEGIDIFADRGTNVVAVEDGQVTRDEDSKGGHVVYLTNPTTARHYYYAHLDTIDGSIPRAPRARSVRAGEYLGTVGTSGNAAGKPPHLHFQMRSRGIVVNPYSALQRADMHASKQTSKRKPTTSTRKKPTPPPRPTPDLPGHAKLPPKQGGPISYDAAPGESGNWVAKTAEVGVVVLLIMGLYTWVRYGQRPSRR